MAVLATIAFATLLLEDDYLLALYKRLENLANHLGTLYGGAPTFTALSASARSTRSNSTVSPSL